MKAALMAAMAILAAPLAAAAQSGPTMVEALVVNARTPGPAWWSVSKGDAKVWVLGLMRVGFKGDDRWDSGVFERRLGRGGRLIYADANPTVRISPDDTTTSRPWVDRLAPDDYNYFAEAVRIARADPASIGSMKPDAAAFSMNYTANPPRFDPTLRLLTHARKLDAKVSLVGESLIPAFRLSMRDARSDDFTCLNSISRKIVERDKDRAKAEAWMRGDVRQLVLGRMAYNPCQTGQPKMDAARRRQDDALAEAIAKTLDEGQNAVALVDLMPLLRQEGVLDRLRTRGYVIRTPAQLDED